MNLCISSLAWKPAEDGAVARLLGAHGFKGIELVPTKLWPDLSRVQEAEARDYRRKWDDRGIRIVAMQALLFGRDDLAIFGSEAKREEGIEYFKSVFNIARWLGARALVYGSPIHRQGIDGRDEALLQVAERYFRRLGAMAGEQGLCLCIEPLPRSYPCDFISSSAEALRFVERVNQEGFGLHFDAASLFAGGEDVAETLRSARGRIEHFHLSEPGLGHVNPGAPVPVGDYLRLLDAQGYGNWASIEMREPDPSGSNVSAIETSLRFIRRLADQAHPSR